MAKLTYGPKQKETAAERERERERVKLRRRTTRKQEEIGKRREKGIEKVTGEMMERVRGSNRRQGEINRLMKQ